MLSFKEFMKEDQQHIDINPEFALTQIDKINEDLEAVTLTPFVNSALFVNAVRGTLERYGIVLPAYSNMQQLSLEGETVYALGETGYHVYMVWNLDEDHACEGYATIADQEELDDLYSLDDDGEEPSEGKPDQPTEWMKYPKARRDDDSGNDLEYV